MTDPILAKPPHITTAGGIPGKYLYRVPRGFLREMHTWNLDRNALRLLHVLLYRTCRDCQDWWLGTYPQPQAGLSETFRSVKAWQGTCPDRSNGAMLRAMQQLSATGAFDWIDAHHLDCPPFRPDNPA